MVEVHPLAQLGLYVALGWYSFDLMIARTRTSIRASRMGISELEEKIAGYNTLQRILSPFQYITYRNELNRR